MKISAASFFQVAVVGLGLFALPAAGWAQASKPGWVTDQPQALAKARTEKKLVLMDFTGSDWCGWCMKLDKEVFSTPEFQKYAQDHLVLVELDFPHKKQLPPALKTQNDMLGKKYAIEGFPTIIVLDPQGNKVGELGYQPGGPVAFIAALEKLKPTGAMTSQTAPAVTAPQTAQTAASRPAANNPLGSAHVQGSTGL